MSALPSGVDQSPRAMAERSLTDFYRIALPYANDAEVARLVGRTLAHGPVLVDVLRKVPSPEAEKRQLRQQARQEVSAEDAALEMKREGMAMVATADEILRGVASRYAPDFNHYNPDDRNDDRDADRAREASQHEAGASQAVKL